MTNTNYIVAIDLGTSCIKGIIGTRSFTGAYTVIACETESSAGCIRRGIIYNVGSASERIAKLLRKLSAKVPGIQIKKVYVGAGGQSIRSMDHVVAKSLGTDSEVKKETTEELYNECLAFKPEGLDVLSVVSPVFYLDGNPEVDPVGIPCSHIEARYKLIVCRPSLKQRIYSIAERTKIEIAGIFISSLALADVVLNETGKDLGCALLDFGAGTSSLTIFKNKQLIGLYTIPLGSHLITRDITDLNVTETEAERLKKTYGDATADKEKDSPVQVNNQNGAGPRQIKLSDINDAVKARLQEITENIYARLEESGVAGKLSAGMIITGGGAFLKNFDAAIRERFKMIVRYATADQTLFEKTNTPVDPEYGVVAGLLLKGTVNCSYTPPVFVPTPQPPVPPIVKEPIVKEPVVEEPIIEEPAEDSGPGGEERGGKRKGKGKGKGTGGFIDRVATTAIHFANNLFNDDDFEDAKEEADTEKKDTNNK